MNKLKVLYFGHNPKYLEAIREVSNLIGVFIHDFRGEGLYERSLILLELCKKYDIRVYNKTRLDENAVSLIRSMGPDIIVCGEYHNILNEDIISIPKIACLNIHGSLLPKYRGVHPLNWMVINGEKEGGTTIHYVNAGIDSGLIIDQERYPIEIHDTAYKLRTKVEKCGVSLIKKTIQRFHFGEYVKGFSQNEDESSYYPPRKPIDGLIDWSMSAYEIHNLVRAVSKPYPGAFTYYKCEKITIWKTMFSNNRNTEPYGTILKISHNEIDVVTGEGIIHILEWIPENIIFQLYDLFDRG